MHLVSESFWRSDENFTFKLSSPVPHNITPQVTSECTRGGPQPECHLEVVMYRSDLEAAFVQTERSLGDVLLPQPDFESLEAFHGANEAARALVRRLVSQQ